jgi:curved DNA-binding protein CbpA
MAETIETPRKDIVHVKSPILEEADALVKSGKLREAVTLIFQNRYTDKHKSNIAASNSLPPLLVDAGSLLYSTMMKLREDPWSVLSLKESDDPDDKEIKKAFRELALKFHPDKSKFESTELFACIYSAYETIETEDKRNKFVIKREEEVLERQAAKAAGSRAERELEKKYAKMRMAQERESYQKWRSTQQVVFAKWEKDDHELKLHQVERERSDRRRDYLEKERKLRGNKMESDRLKRIETHRKHQSSSIQKKLQAEEDEARSMIAVLEKQREELLIARNKAKLGNANNNELVKSLVPSATRASKKSANTTNSGGSSSSSSKTKPTSGNNSKRTTSGVSQKENNNSFRALSLHNDKEEPQICEDKCDRCDGNDGDDEISAVFIKEGPMGFTLVNIESLLDQVDTNKDAKNQKSNIKSNSSKSSRSIISGVSSGSSWSASVLKLEYDSETGKCEAETLGVGVGDVIVSINGYETRGMAFNELCAFLGRSTFPRTLLFRRRKDIAKGELL